MLLEGKVVIVTGAGRAFCAGGDLDFSKFKDKEVITQEDTAFWPRTTREVRRGILPPKVQKKVMLGLQNLPMPTMAVVNGVAAGFGFDLALA
jgi:enoyl-CoA hydratase/carnithine racemase